MGNQPVAEPFAIGPGLAPCFQTLGVAGAVAVEHVKELFPVGFGKIPAAFFLVPFQVRVGNGQPKERGLWRGLIDKFLSYTNGINF